MTYCSGKLNECTSDIIVTIANITMPSPGVIAHEYTDAPLAPQVIDQSVRLIKFLHCSTIDYRLKVGELSHGRIKETTL